MSIENCFSLLLLSKAFSLNKRPVADMVFLNTCPMLTISVYIIPFVNVILQLYNIHIHTVTRLIEHMTQF